MPCINGTVQWRLKSKGPLAAEHIPTTYSILNNQIETTYIKKCNNLFLEKKLKIKFGTTYIQGHVTSALLFMYYS